MSRNRIRWRVIGLGLAAGLLLVLLGITFFLSRQPSVVPPGPEAVSGEEALLVQGKDLYAAHCAACHGERGEGEGPAARYLYPRPRNFGEAKFRLVTTTNRVPSDDDLLHAITRGMPGSAMFPFGHLSEADRRALVAYVRHLTRSRLEEQFHQAAKAAGDEIDPEELAELVAERTQPGSPIEVPRTWPPFGPESIARGHELYHKTCATCHGETGKGDGAQDQRDDDGTPTRPRDFGLGIFKGGRDHAQLYARLVLGMPGTPMPATDFRTPDEAGDMINFMRSLFEPGVAARVEHQRTQLVARRVSGGSLPEAVNGSAWEAVPARLIVVSPLWWRTYVPPDLQVQALHDGQSLVLRLSWLDATCDEGMERPEDFEDMASVQLFQGSSEPFLGMGSDHGPVDLWLWRASWQRPASDALSLLDDYPFDTPLYRQLVKGNGKGPPDFLTARAAGNLQANPERERTASSLAARGFGSTTFAPKTSQHVTTQSAWRDGRWTVVLRRPLAVGQGEGQRLQPGGSYSIAFAVWDGAAHDRNGQKLVSIWHDLKIE